MEKKADKIRTTAFQKIILRKMKTTWTLYVKMNPLDRSIYSSWLDGGIIEEQLATTIAALIRNGAIEYPTTDNFVRRVPAFGVNYTIHRLKPTQAGLDSLKRRRS